SLPKGSVTSRTAITIDLSLLGHFAVQPACQLAAERRARRKDRPVKVFPGPQDADGREQAAATPKYWGTPNYLRVTTDAECRAVSSVLRGSMGADRALPPHPRRRARAIASGRGPARCGAVPCPGASGFRSWPSAEGSGARSGVSPRPPR